MTILDSLKPYLTSFEPFVTEDDVVVHDCPLIDFVIALDNNVDMLWKETDFVLAESYYQQTCNGEQAPAIIVNGKGHVIDGYHRLWAAFKYWRENDGPNFIKTINLGDLFKIVSDAYDD